MELNFFPVFLDALPRPKSTIAKINARLVKSEHALAMFYEAHEGAIEVDEHMHGAQWGVVLEGFMELTIDGETTRYERGDTYYVPAGVPHCARIEKGYVGIDVFADADRYEPDR